MLRLNSAAKYNMLYVVVLIKAEIHRLDNFLSNVTCQTPRHLFSDAHEWINEIPTVPIYYLAKSQPRERTWEDQWGKKTLLSLTLVSYCGGTSLA